MKVWIRPGVMYLVHNPQTRKYEVNFNGNEELEGVWLGKVSNSEEVRLNDGRVCQVNQFNLRWENED